MFDQSYRDALYAVARDEAIRLAQNIPMIVNIEHNSLALKLFMNNSKISAYLKYVAYNDDIKLDLALKLVRNATHPTDTP